MIDLQFGYLNVRSGFCNPAVLFLVTGLQTLPIGIFCELIIFAKAALGVC